MLYSVSDDKEREWEDAYENQRFWPHSGWSSKLLPTDRYQFSDVDGKETRELASIRLPDSGEWTWEGDWVKGEWVYSFDFPEAWKWTRKPKINSWVRRRLWRRSRIKLKTSFHNNTASAAGAAPPWRTHFLKQLQDVNETRASLSPDLRVFFPHDQADCINCDATFSDFELVKLECTHRVCYECASTLLVRQADYNSQNLTPTQCMQFHPMIVCPRCFQPTFLKYRETKEKQTILVRDPDRCSVFMTMVDEIYENQRRHVMGPFSSSYLLPTDRAMYTNSCGDPQKRTVLLDDSPWVWVSDWFVNKERYTNEQRAVDRDGWEYSWNWHTWYREYATMRFVRRRAFVRIRVGNRHEIETYNATHPNSRDGIKRSTNFAASGSGQFDTEYTYHPQSFMHAPWRKPMRSMSPEVAIRKARKTHYGGTSPLLKTASSPSIVSGEALRRARTAGDLETRQDRHKCGFTDGAVNSASYKKTTKHRSYTTITLAGKDARDEVHMPYSGIKLFLLQLQCLPEFESFDVECEKLHKLPVLSLLPRTADDDDDSTENDDGSSSDIENDPNNFNFPRNFTINTTSPVSHSTPNTSHVYQSFTITGI